MRFKPPSSAAPTPTSEDTQTQQVPITAPAISPPLATAPEEPTSALASPPLTPSSPQQGTSMSSTPGHTSTRGAMPTSSPTSVPTQAQDSNVESTVLGHSSSPTSGLFTHELPTESTSSQSLQSTECDKSAPDTTRSALFSKLTPSSPRLKLTPVSSSKKSNATQDGEGAASKTLSVETSSASKHAYIPRYGRSVNASFASQVLGSQDSLESAPKNTLSETHTPNTTPPSSIETSASSLGKRKASRELEAEKEENTHPKMLGHAPGFRFGKRISGKSVPPSSVSIEGEATPKSTTFKGRASTATPFSSAETFVPLAKKRKVKQQSVSQEEINLFESPFRYSQNATPSTYVPNKSQNVFQQAASFYQATSSTHVPNKSQHVFGQAASFTQATHRPSSGSFLQNLNWNKRVPFSSTTTSSPFANLGRGRGKAAWKADQKEESKPGSEEPNVKRAPFSSTTTSGSFANLGRGQGKTADKADRKEEAKPEETNIKLEKNQASSSTQPSPPTSASSSSSFSSKNKKNGKKEAKFQHGKKEAEAKCDDSKQYESDFRDYGERFANRARREREENLDAERESLKALEKELRERQEPQTGKKRKADDTDEPELESSPKPPEADIRGTKRVRFSRPEVTGVSQPLSTAEAVPHQLSPDHKKRVKAARHVMRNRDNHYAVLGLQYSPMLTKAQFKNAWRGTLLKTHPDKLPVSYMTLATEATQIVNAAFELLSDPVKKSKYDRNRRPFSQPANSSPASSSSSFASPSPPPTETAPQGGFASFTVNDPPTPPPTNPSPYRPYNFGGFGGYESYGINTPSGGFGINTPSAGWTGSGNHGMFSSTHNPGLFMSSRSQSEYPDSGRPVCLNSRFCGRPVYLDEL